MTFEDVKEKIVPVLKQSGVEYAGVFGSVARGEARSHSDVDILVKFIDTATFSAYLDLSDSLRDALGKNVDLITEGGVNKFLRPQIERDLQMVYGQR